MLFPCADGSPKLFNLPQQFSARRRLEQDETEDEDTIFEQEISEYAWAMSRGLIFRHHEVHRTKLYIQDESIFTIPFKHVDVRRQTRTSNDNAFEHALNDCWNDEREVLLSGVGTTRFQILRVKLPEGCTLVTGRPTKVKKREHDLLRFGPKTGPDCQRNESKRRLPLGTKKGPDCEKLVKSGSFCVSSQDRRPRSDLQSSSETRKVRGSINAVYPPNRNVRGTQTRRNIDIGMLGET